MARSIQECNFGKLQRDRVLEMKGWANKITQLKVDEKSLKIGIVDGNNHYGGFGPGTVNIFKEMADMVPIIFANIVPKDTANQLGLERNFKFVLREV